MSKTLIINYHPLNQAGGVQSVITTIIQGQKNFSVLSGAEPKSEISSNPKINEYQTHSFYEKKVTPELEEILNHVFAKENPQIIYTHNLSYMFSAEVGAYIFNYFKERGCVMIEHAHHAMIRRKARAKRILSLEWDAIIVVSKYASKQIFPFVNKKSKKFIIYNGINLKDFTKTDNNLRKEMNLNKKHILLFPSRTVRMSTGKIGEQKQFKTVLKALSKIKNKQNYALIIPYLGNKNNEKVREFYSLINKMGLEGNVIEFPKRILQEEMYKFYSMGDIVLFPSLQESFGMITIEAWASEKAIIGAKSGAIPEIIQNNKNGLLFEAKSSKDLREKIESLIENKKLYNTIISNGKKEVTKFTDKIMLRNILQAIFSTPKKNKIYLIRHGETTYNANNLFTGQANPSLTKKGRDQAKRLKKFVKNLEDYVAYCSPLKRSLDTAKISGVKNPLILDELKEIDVGTFESKTREEIEKTLGKINFEKIKSTPKGESLEDLRKRLTPFVKKLNKNKDTVIVAHEVVNKSLASMITGEDYFSIKRQRNEDVIIISDKKLGIITLK